MVKGTGYRARASDPPMFHFQIVSLVRVRRVSTVALLTTWEAEQESPAVLWSWGLRGREKGKKRKGL